MRRVDWSIWGVVDDGMSMMCGNMSLIYLIPYTIISYIYIYTVGLLVIGFHLLLVSAGHTPDAGCICGSPFCFFTQAACEGVGGIYSFSM